VIRTRHKAIIQLTLVAAVVSSLHSQAQQQREQDELLRLSTELVVVDAQVLSKKTGTPINGLKQQDFVLYEEGVRQPISHFSQDKLSLSIVLLLDVSGSVMPVINQVRESGIRALSQLKTDDEVAVMAFGVWASVLQNFTRNRQLIAERVASIEEMGPWIREGTHIHEAVYEAAKYLEKALNPNSRRIIVIVTDNLSNQVPSQGHSESEAMQELHTSGAAVCGLVVGDFNGAVNEYKKKGLILDDSIGGYITETGGILSQVDKDDVTAKLGRLIERLRSRYSLGYTPLNGKKDGKFRNIRLKLSPEVERREGRITIVARKGYYAAVKN
jgi:VWFA-related protein